MTSPVLFPLSIDRGLSIDIHIYMDTDIHIRNTPWYSIDIHMIHSIDIPPEPFFALHRCEAVGCGTENRQIENWLVSKQNTSNQ